MKNIFPGYSKKTEKEIKQLWEKGIIMFDANVLLNLYRYSNETRGTIIDLINKFKDKIFLPHQSALEYNRNRYEVIADQEKAYKEFIDKIEQIQKDLQSTSKPPFLSEKVHNDLNSIFKEVNSEVEKSIEKYCGYLKHDPIYDELSELFYERISEPYDEEKLNSLYEEGKKRYETKIPPGYEDEKSKEGNKKYGDYILWSQVIDKAKETKSPVIFITDERKKDWWWKIKDGRNMGPRQELVEEMSLKAQVEFHMYSSERFLSFGQSFLEEQVNQEALEEIKAMKLAEIEQSRRIQRITERVILRRLRSQEQLDFLKDRRNELKNNIFQIDTHQKSLMRESVDNSDIPEYIHNLSIQKAELESELNEINESLERFEINIADDNRIIHRIPTTEYIKRIIEENENKDDENN